MMGAVMSYAKSELERRTIVCEFKKEYEQYGKHDIQRQVPHLRKLADYYLQRYRVTNDWRDCLKVKNSIYYG